MTKVKIIIFFVLFIIAQIKSENNYIKHIAHEDRDSLEEGSKWFQIFLNSNKNITIIHMSINNQKYGDAGHSYSRSDIYYTGELDKNFVAINHCSKIIISCFLFKLSIMLLL